MVAVAAETQAFPGAAAVAGGVAAAKHRDAGGAGAQVWLGGAAAVEEVAGLAAPLRCVMMVMVTVMVMGMVMVMVMVMVMMGLLI